MNACGQVGIARVVCHIHPLTSSPTHEVAILTLREKAVFCEDLELGA